MNRSVTLPVIIVITILVLLCCIALVVGLGIAYFSFNQVATSSDGPSTWDYGTTPTPVVIRPTPRVSPQPVNTPAPGETPPAQPGFSEPSAHLAQPAPLLDNLRLLEDAKIPTSDLYDLARRIEGKDGVPLTIESPAPPYSFGSEETFWVSNSDTNDYFQVNAVLRYITPHAYFWIEEGVSYQEDELAALSEAFEAKIYPKTREFFGSEWTPGVDNDPHIYILYASGVGSGIAGYFASNDSYNPEIQEYSNGHEMFVFNADAAALDDEFTYGVLAHEFQHMIQWSRDRDESTWMNESFSDLAMHINGYDNGGHDYLYALDPDLQLNDWPTDEGLTSPHYGASFLFGNYFLGRFGEDLTRLLVAHPANGLESIDQLLAEQGVTDSLNGEPISADDVFADWVAASFLQDGSLADGRYTYSLYPDAPQPTETESIRSCDGDMRTRDVRQYGVDYIQIDCSQDATLYFEGSSQVGLFPTSPHSGAYAFWSNKGDESDMTLTQVFDFTGHSGMLTLEYWTWYDIEEEYDYVYLLASEDGERWEMLFPPSGTGEDPTGANFGWGYSGASGSSPQWIQERVDISQFSGKKVYLRFEYVTDAAVNGEGLLLDDIAIPEIGYASSFDQDDGGWQADGFVRVQDSLPQSFRLTLITRERGKTSVAPVQISLDNSASIPLKFGDGVEEAYLVVSGTTRYTRQPAAYRFYFQP